MQIVINVTNIQIIQWTVDVAAQRVVVDFQSLTDTGEPYERKQAIFWVTMPVDPVDPFGNPITDTSLWYTLPPEYVQTLTDLTIDARAALLPLIA